MKLVIVGLAGAAQVAGVILAVSGIYTATTPPVLSELSRPERFFWGATVLLLIPSTVFSYFAFRWVLRAGALKRTILALAMTIGSVSILTVALYFTAYALNNYDEVLILGWALLAAVGGFIHVWIGRRKKRVFKPTIEPEAQQ